MNDQIQPAKVIDKKEAKIKKKDKKKKSRFGRWFRKETDGPEMTEENNKPLRVISFNQQGLPHRPHENHHFINNRIDTTKYTFLSFLPKSILFQFLRVSNVYFLITAILCFIPNFSPLPGFSALVPLAFVLFMSMMREAYEDIKRRRNDIVTNSQTCRILREKSSDQDLIKEILNTINSNHNRQDLSKLKSYFKECKWSDVRCGDIIYCEEGDYLSADVLLLLSSAENGECFVQTSSLDGERALKHKQCLVPIKKAIEQQGLYNFNFQIHCEAPIKNLYEFHGYIESEQFPEQGTVSLSAQSKIRSITLDSKQVGLRGSNVANTNWIIGAVIYTGKETKLMLNQGKSRYKVSKIEKVVNIICIYLIIIQAVLCLIMSIYAGFYTSNYASTQKDGIKRKAEYIFYSELNAQGLNQTDSSIYEPAVTGVLTYGQYYILLNTLIPISLVVSLEFVKLIQTPFINHDTQMYDEEGMKQAQPVSMTLHEEMASIKYIFADKTGTLTSNVMQFKACTIGSVCYDEEYNEEDYEYEMDDDDQTPGNKEEIKEEEIILQDIQDNGLQKAQEFQQYKIAAGHPYNVPGQEIKLNMNRKSSITKIVWSFAESIRIIKGLLETKKSFINEETNMGRTSIQGPELILRKQNEYLHQFWLNVILCHDVIVIKDQENKLAYQGSSPDEITLLDAAKEVGYIFLDRNSESMTVDIFGKQKHYKLLQKIEFTSDRKKMTVIVQDMETGLIILFSKGADLAIFERLSQKIEQHFLDATKEDLIKFSTKGFRTLCFGMRVLDQDFYYDWEHRYELSKLDAIKLGPGKKKIIQLEETQTQLLQNEIESELFLLGATALEDKLQDGVPECIEDFHNAGIKVWMLTGDKLETAENIGFSSKMFNEKMYIFKLQTQEKQSTRVRLNQVEQKIIEIEKAHQTPIIGTQFILNPNAASDYGIRNRDQPLRMPVDTEARNIIKALEEFKHDCKYSEYTLNDSWARKPALKRKLRKRLEEIVPDKNAIVERIIRENQVFYRQENDQRQYIPSTFDMAAHQYIVRKTNIYRSSTTKKDKLGFSTTTQGENEDQFGILVEGTTLHYIMDSTSMRKKFLKILQKCDAVIVCRASPSQKGLVVQMIKDNEPNAVTLAIGDGGNDVNMIQRAHIGIGIFGKEGYQAAGNSDYAIGQFKFLRRLLFVHGRWSGIRLSTFMLFFFNKNIVFTLPQFWFGWYNGFSGQSYFDDCYLTTFNTFVTAIAVCAMAVWDQDINYENKEQKDLLEFFMPLIYKDAHENELFTTKKFLVWAIISILQSIAIYGIPSVAYSNLIFEGGKNEDLWTISACSWFGIVFLHYGLICGFTKNWTIWMIFMYLCSFFFFPFVVVLYNYLTFGLSWNPIYMRLSEFAFSNVEFWLIQIIVISASIIPIIFYYKCQSLMFPTLKDLILQNRLEYDEIIAEADPEKAKAAHDLFKHQQQQLFQQWQAEYSNFQQPKHHHVDNQNDHENILISNSNSNRGSQLNPDSTTQQQQHVQNNNLSHLELSPSRFHFSRKGQKSATHLISHRKHEEEKLPYMESQRSENFLNQSIISMNSEEDGLGQKLSKYVRGMFNKSVSKDEGSNKQRKETENAKTSNRNQIEVKIDQQQ